MIKSKLLLSTTALFTSMLITEQANAISAFGTPLNNAYPGKNLYTGSCLTCHATPTGENIAWFSQYGKILLSQGANYGNPATFPAVIERAGKLDYDNDGFTVDQEIYGGSFTDGVLANNPSTFFVGSKSDSSRTAFGLATAPATLDYLSSTLDNSPYIIVPNSHKNIVSGVIDYTLSNVTTQGTTKFLFNTGGIQPNPTVQFVDTLNATSTIIPAMGSTDGSWTVGNDGSISVTITDDGAFDLYSVANFQAKAIARSTNFTPTNVFDIYTGVSPDAKISPLATVVDGATIDPYAIIDAYAFIDAGATIGSYAYVSPNTYVNAIVDPYVSVNADVYTQVSLPNPVGTISSRIAITTTAPATGVIAGGAAGSANDSGSLHCMTTGLGTQGLMFLGLLGATFLVRRKLN